MTATPSETAPLHVVAARASGRGAIERRLAPLESLARSADRVCCIERVESASGLAAAAQRAVQAALSDGGIVIGSGGDGSLAEIARQVVPAGVPFAIVPGGTFNLLARTHGIPEDAEAAARVVLHGDWIHSRVGRVNDTLFFVNASLGLYPRVLEDRESYKRRFGRRRAIAVLAAFATVASGLSTLHLTLNADDNGARPLDSPTLFVGNNALQLERVEVKPAPDDQHLVCFSSQPVERWQAFSLMIRAALHRLGGSPSVERLEFRSLEVERRRRSGRVRERIATRIADRVALDGEMHRIAPPWRFSVNEQPLNLRVPT